MAEIIRAAQISEHPRRLDGRTGALLGPSPVETAAPTTHEPEPEPLPVPPSNLAELERIEALEAALEEARARAARAEAQVMVLEAEQAAEAEERRAAGFERGREEGLESAGLEAEERLQVELEGIRRIGAEAAAALRARLEERVEDSVVEIVCAAVAKMVGAAVADPASVTAMVRRMLDEVERREAVTVHVCPDDYELLQRAHGEAGGSHNGPQVSFVPDERVEYGGCIVETAAGELDGRLETQFRRFRDLMLEARRQQADDGGAAP
jgi:flagellar biosynthesis/type III secretory pathway protein FliH